MGGIDPQESAAWRRLVRPRRLALLGETPTLMSEAERAREEAASWLILLDDDPDDEVQQARFRAWLNASSGHADAWRSVSRTGNLLAAAADLPLSAQVPQSQVHADRRLRPKASRGRRAAYGAGAALAACLVLLVAPTLTLRLCADYVTGTAQVETNQLDDGTQVRLGPDSAIRLAFSAGERRVELLSGEALFDVTHDPARPFRVDARDAVATDLGTRFDVAVLGPATAVAVNRGRVQVDPTAGGAPYDLTAGDWVRVNTAGPVEQGTDLPELLTAGPDARVAARNRPVAEVIDRIRPWYGGRIVVADETIGRGLVTGVFDAADPARALEALVGPQGGRVIRITPWLLIVSKS